MIFKIKNAEDKKRVIAYIGALPENRKYEANIKQDRVIRTLPQNRLYWLWLGCICHETGNDKDYLHEYFGKKYLPKKEMVIFGQMITRPVSTTSLDTKQFTDYLDRIQQFASAELGIVLPDPQSQYWKEFYEQYKNFI